MLCGSPLKLGQKHVPCGQCMNCRINSKRAWIGRMSLEAAFTPGFNSFVTLTYGEKYLPEGGTLVSEHLTTYYDRLRKSTGMGPVRYFAVGEYGRKSHRPHYHLILFGVDPTKWQERIKSCWTNSQNNESQGFVDIGIVDGGAIDYVANYSCKKLTGDLADEYLKGRRKEFTRMSKKPPLGKAGFFHIRSLLQKREGAAALASKGDVPHSYRVAGKVYPMTQYWIDWMRCEIGIEKPTYTPWEISIGEASKDRAKAARQAAKAYKAERSKESRYKI